MKGKRTALRLPSTVRKLDEYERGWIEAAIDGEGSFLLRKTKHNNWHCTLEISNTDKRFLEKAKKMIGDGKIYSSYEKKERRFQLFRRNALIDLLSQLSLTIKERQRILIIEALGLIQRREYEPLVSILQEFKILNERNKFAQSE